MDKDIQIGKTSVGTTDSDFSNSIYKTNSIQKLKKVGIKEVRSL